MTAENLNIDYKSSRFFSILFLVIYLIALTIFCIEYHVIPTAEFLIIGFLIYAVYNQKTWRFLKDWLPFIIVFVSYEIMYSFVGSINANNLHTGPYYFDLTLFGGQIPTIILQSTIRCAALDYIGAIFYSFHFFAPTVFAFILWKKSPPNYWKYTVAFGICTYAALITFLFYPVAPPWIEVPGVVRVLTQSVDANLGLPVYKTLFDLLSPNLYAAFPSMHSALPFLVALFSIKIWKKKGLIVLIFPIGVWFSAVYLGEHYFVDVLDGILYAALAFIAVEKLLPIIVKKNKWLRKHIPAI